MPWRSYHLNQYAIDARNCVLVCLFSSLHKSCTEYVHGSFVQNMFMEKGPTMPDRKHGSKNGGLHTHCERGQCSMVIHTMLFHAPLKVLLLIITYRVLNIFQLLGAACVGLVGYYMDHGYWRYNQKAELFYLLVAVSFLIGTFCLITSHLVSLSSSMISKTVYVSIYKKVFYLNNLKISYIICSIIFQLLFS